MPVQDLQRIGAPKRGRSPWIGVALAVAALAGCAREASTTVPAPCTRGRGAVRMALVAAPGDVRLDGRRISECFVRGADQAAVQEAGVVFLPVAERLAPEVRARPSSPAALRLGFLMGAIRRGTADTQGIYSELMRRLGQELSGVDLRSATYLRGQRAGAGHG